MQCAVKRRRCSSLDSVDIEQQQQSLFDVSIIKLQHEQLRHGVEPRLLRFVLINNALRSLQGHMLHIDDNETLISLPSVVGGAGGGGSEDGAGLPCESSDIFFYNTFKDGSLSSIPLSPPTPVKVMKLDNGLSNDQSPLIEFQDAISSSPCPSQDILTSPCEERVHPAATFYDGVGCEEEESDEGGGGDGEDGGGGGGGADMCNGVGLKEKRLQNGYSNTDSIHVPGSPPLLGKRSRGELSSHDHDHMGGRSKGNSRCRSLEQDGSGGGGGDSLGGSDPKKCKPSSLIINSTIQKVQGGLNGLSSLNGFLDLEPFPTLPFPSSSSSSSHSSSGHTSTSPSPTSPLPPHYHHSHYATSAEESDKDSLTPSPIDFTNVDPTLYDFDTAVLQVESTAGVGALDTQESGSLPNPLAAVVVPLPVRAQSSHVSTATTTTSDEAVSPVTVVASTASSSTLHLTNHLSSSPLQSTVICSPPASHCPSPLGSSSSTLSTDQTLLQHNHQPQQQQGECTSCDSSNGGLEANSSETEKLSLVSADSTVLTAVSASPVGSPVKSSCSMEAIVRAQSGEAEGLSQNGGSISDSSSGGLSTSPEHSVEPDFLDEIEHIVELLMT